MTKIKMDKNLVKIKKNKKRQEVEARRPTRKLFN